MSPLRDVVATTGMGAGPLEAASLDFAPASLGHRRYNAKPSTTKAARARTTHSQRRRFGVVPLPMRACGGAGGAISKGGLCCSTILVNHEFHLTFS